MVGLPDKQKLDKEVREPTNSCLEKQHLKDPGDEATGFLRISPHDVMKSTERDPFLVGSFDIL